MTSGECPSEDQLVRMVEGVLSSDSLVGIESHINTCELCMAVVSGLGALNEPPKARTVERYQLDRKIGGGGMGEVWAAWDPKLRREVAVKLVRPDRADEGKERARLLREAQALARLTHPNVVAVHDVGEIDGEVFIATELVAGDTLASRGGPSVDWKTIAGLYAQAARGLAAAHAAGLVHRDVKPANLLVGVDGRVRVADFGLAVRADSNRVPPPDAGTGAPGDGSGLSITAAGHVAGTPAYMAPEQRAGDPPEAPADQFALCVALGEAIAGRRPPIAVTREAMIAFVAERRPREPGLDELCGIIARGTALEPTDRFPDMATLAGLLEDLAGTRTPATVVVRDDKPTESPPRPSEQVRSSSMRKAAIAVTALAIVGATTAVLLRDRGSTKREPAATRAPDDAALDGAAPTHDGGSVAASGSGLGLGIGFAAGGNGNGGSAAAGGSVPGNGAGSSVPGNGAGNGDSAAGNGVGSPPAGNGGGRTTSGPTTGGNSARRPPPTRVAAADDLPSSPPAQFPATISQIACAVATRKSLGGGSRSRS